MMPESNTPHSRPGKWSVAYWQNKLPTRERIFASRWFAPFAHWFDHPEFWRFERNKVALAVAIGLFCGMLPAPTQFFSALMLAYLLRTHLPIALFSTLYTNPLTLVPLYIAAYELGFWLLSGAAPHPDLVLPAWGEPEFWSQLSGWAARFGKPLLLGILLMGTVFAISGYLLVQVLWRLHQRWHRQ